LERLSNLVQLSRRRYFHRYFRRYFRRYFHRYFRPIHYLFLLGSHCVELKLFLMK
jgi:hypothetical protein